jgi:RNA-directed DNA polymerase
VKPLVEAFLRDRGLELSPEKTTITHIDDGFDFLGQNIRKYHGKLLIKPSDKSVKAFLRKVRTIIKNNKSAAAGTLICQLNPIIRGWAMYHRHAVSSVVFQSVDHAIYQALWRWAKRRHSNKGARWVKARYFHSVGNRNWVFTGKVPVQQGLPADVHLFAAHSLRITRHIKIDGQVNPYDPHWELYLEKRQTRSMAASLRGRKTLLYLLRRQQGRCLRCGDAITPETGWHTHRRVSRSQGGSDTTDNWVLLHPVCHSELHYANDALG